MSFHSKYYLRVITLGSEILQIIDEEDKLKIAELKCEEIENLLKSWESELQRQKDAQQSTHYELICSLQSLQNQKLSLGRERAKCEDHGKEFEIEIKSQKENLQKNKQLRTSISQWKGAAKSSAYAYSFLAAVSLVIAPWWARRFLGRFAENSEQLKMLRYRGENVDQSNSSATTSIKETQSKYERNLKQIEELQFKQSSIDKCLKENQIQIQLVSKLIEVTFFWRSESREVDTRNGSLKQSLDKVNKQQRKQIRRSTRSMIRTAVSDLVTCLAKSNVLDFIEDKVTRQEIKFHQSKLEQFALTFAKSDTDPLVRASTQLYQRRNICSTSPDFAARRPEIAWMPSPKIGLSIFIVLLFYLLAFLYDVFMCIIFRTLPKLE